MKELVSNGVGRCRVTIESRNKNGSCLQKKRVWWVAAREQPYLLGFVMVWGTVGRRHTEEEDGSHATRDIFFGFVSSCELEEKRE